jgi:hypothetical protein
MKPLRYGINKVPGSGTIEMYPDMPIRIRLPERPMEETVYEDKPQAVNNPNAMMRSEALRSMAYKGTLDPNNAENDTFDTVNADDDASLNESTYGLSDELANSTLDERIKRLNEERAKLEAESNSFIPKSIRKKDQKNQEAIDLLKKNRNKVAEYDEDY